jgi:hypothetical protein
MPRADADADRYRRAVEYTLQHLEWCIGYLHGIGEMKARVRSRATAA